VSRASALDCIHLWWLVVTYGAESHGGPVAVAAVQPVHHVTEQVHNVAAVPHVDVLLHMAFFCAAVQGAIPVCGSTQKSP
jgi:hypothetical protein